MAYECDCGARYNSLDALHACQNARHYEPFCSADDKIAELHQRIERIEATLAALMEKAK